jgi:peptidoglycan/xylan/chitin deacetylase (PgdA/CDA1 family)
MLKRIVTLVVSALVGGSDWLRDRACRLLGRPTQTKCVILAYHAVNAKERSRFSWQMDLLQRSAQPVSACVKSLPAQGGQFVAVTFDDGLENILENALPELKTRRIPATLFIVTELLGRTRDWEHYGGDDTRHEKVMSLEQLLQLLSSDSELITIGSHTMTHPMLTRIGKKELDQELLGSRKKLEHLLNRDITLFSFPYGAFNELAVEACREARYERVFTALPVLALSNADEFVTGRVGVAPGDWQIEFRLKLAGAYRWLPQAYGLKRLVMATLRGGPGKLPALKTEKKGAA